MTQHCEACGADRGGRNRNLGMEVGHLDSEKRIWFCPEHTREAAVRRTITRETFAGLMEDRRAAFRRRPKSEANRLERADNKAARYATPLAAS